MTCAHFEHCNAPLCPQNAESLEHAAWFPDEEICKLSNAPAWVRRQRRIARVANPEGLFTVAMLAADCILRRGIQGLDPDRAAASRQNDEAKWLADHPALTASQREKMRERAAKNPVPPSGDRDTFPPPRPGVEGICPLICENVRGSR